MKEINSLKEYFEVLNEIYDGVLENQHCIRIDHEKGKGTIEGFEIENGLFAFYYSVNFFQEMFVNFKMNEVEGYDYKANIFLFDNASVNRYKNNQVIEHVSHKNWFYIRSIEHQINSSVSENSNGKMIVFLYSKKILSNYLPDETINTFYNEERFYHYFENFKELSVVSLSLSDLKNLPSNYIQKYTISSLRSIFMMIMRHQIKESMKNELSYINVNLDEKTIHKIIKIKNEIIKDLSTPPNIEEIALQNSITLNNLGKGFQAIFGYSPYKYYQNKRLEQARILIISKKSSIKEIAYEMGFTDMSHFTKTFKKHFGNTPKYYYNS